MRVPLALALLTIAGCTVPIGHIEEAITNGQIDNGDPEVAALLDGSGNAFCSGTLIAPGAVLTAAHCLEQPPLSIYFGATPPNSGDIFDVASVQQHPKYDSDTHAHDIGIVRLLGSPPVRPAPVYSDPFTADFVGMSIRVVGFGRTSTVDQSAARKRSGQSRIDKYTGGSFSFSPSPSQTCFGDSGGPAFGIVGGVEQLLGITSTGDISCGGGATDVLVQSFDTGFVEGYIAGTAASPGVVGGCAFTGGGDAGTGLIAALLLASLASWRWRATRGRCRSFQR